MLEAGGSTPAEQARRCRTPASVTALVKDFVRAYNEGDLPRLEEIFAGEPDFRWYFVQGERVEDSAHRHTLLPYFAHRHVLDDRLRLTALSVSREPGWHGGFDFSVRLRRESDDVGARGTWHGKGAAGCAIFVWSIGKE
ncbi:MAG TPA: hypothetical protein VG318_17995 [Actinomycetota bacterium]|nr:hypothetical protein [Actinomycetota bacterium]